MSPDPENGKIATMPTDTTTHDHEAVLADAVAAHTAARQALADAEAARDDALRAAAHAGVKTGAIRALTGLSRQRVQQIKTAPPADPGTPPDQRV